MRYTYYVYQKVTSTLSTKPLTATFPSTMVVITRFMRRDKLVLKPIILAALEIPILIRQSWLLNSQSVKGGNACMRKTMRALCYNEMKIVLKLTLFITRVNVYGDGFAMIFIVVWAADLGSSIFDRTLMVRP